MTKSKTVDITAEEREIKTKGTVKALRASGYVPAIFYGKGVKENISLKVNEKELNKALSSEAGLNVILNLTMKTKKGEQTEAVIPQDVQIGPISDRVEHIDFRQVNLKEKITTKVPVRMTGTAPGVALGGILVQQLHEIEVKCLPMDIPAQFTIDVSVLATVNSVIKVGEIKFPENVEPLHFHPEQVAVAVVPPKEEKVEVETAPLEQSAEPELIKTKGKEVKEGEEVAPEKGAEAKPAKETKEAAPKADSKK
jgi:large subunit ribosomal protein L25